MPQDVIEAMCINLKCWSPWSPDSANKIGTEEKNTNFAQPYN